MHLFKVKTKMPLYFNLIIILLKGMQCWLLPTLESEMVSICFNFYQFLNRIDWQDAILHHEPILATKGTYKIDFNIAPFFPFSSRRVGRWECI